MYKFYSLPKSLLTIFLALFYCSVANAYPALQLDIEGGVYDNSGEDITSSDTLFTLYAIGSTNATEGGKLSREQLLGPNLSVSFALYGDNKFDGTENSDLFGDVTVDGTAGTWVFGHPPEEDTSNGNNDNLQPHGYFDTWYFEVDFEFNEINEINPYNTQDDTGGTEGGLVKGTGSGAFWEDFVVDWSGLNDDLWDGLGLHMDLYLCEPNPNTGNCDFFAAAPFSKDATTVVPEPGILALFGLGLFGISLVRRKQTT